MEHRVLELEDTWPEWLVCSYALSCLPGPTAVLWHQRWLAAPVLHEHRPVRRSAPPHSAVATCQAGRWTGSREETCTPRQPSPHVVSAPDTTRRDSTIKGEPPCARARPAPTPLQRGTVPAAARRHYSTSPRHSNAAGRPVPHPLSLAGSLAKSLFTSPRCCLRLPLRHWPTTTDRNRATHAPLLRAAPLRTRDGRRVVARAVASAGGTRCAGAAAAEPGTHSRASRWGFSIVAGARNAGGFWRGLLFGTPKPSPAARFGVWFGFAVMDGVTLRHLLRPFAAQEATAGGRATAAPEQLVTNPWAASQPGQPARAVPSNELLAQVPGGYSAFGLAPELKTLFDKPTTSNAADRIDLTRAPLVSSSATLPKYSRHGLTAGSSHQQPTTSNAADIVDLTRAPLVSSSATLPKYSRHGLTAGSSNQQPSAGAPFLNKSANGTGTSTGEGSPNKGGEFFVGEAGLFGVICLCHRLRMSVAKFCEVGGSIADTRWDWPEWACVKSSPEEYMLRSLASRNSGIGKVGLFGGYGKFTEPINNPVYSGDLYIEGGGCSSVDKQMNGSDPCPKQATKINSDLAQHNEPFISTGRKKQPPETANETKYSEGGELTDDTSKNSFISLFLSHLERNSTPEPIDDILNSNEHYHHKALDVACGSDHSNVTSRQIETRVNDNHPKLAPASFHMEGRSEGISYSAAYSGCDPQDPSHAYGQDHLIHGVCQSHLVPNQPNTGILKSCARVSCPTNCMSCTHVGNKSHQIAHGETGVPCFYDKMEDFPKHGFIPGHLCRTHFSRDLGPVPGSKPALQGQDELRACSTRTQRPALCSREHIFQSSCYAYPIDGLHCRSSIGHATDSLAKHSPFDALNTKAQAKGKHQLQMPTRCCTLEGNDKLACQCLGNRIAGRSLSQASHCNDVSGKITERLKNVSEASVADDGSSKAETENKGAYKDSVVSKGQPKFGFSSGSSSIVVTKFQMSPEFRNVSSTAKHRKHKNLCDEGSRIDKCSASSYVPTSSTGGEEAINSFTRTQLGPSRVKRKCNQVPEGSRLDEKDYEELCFGLPKKFRALKCSGKNSKSDDCTRTGSQSSQKGGCQPQNVVNSFPCRVLKTKRKQPTMQLNKPVKRLHSQNKVFKGDTEQPDSKGDSFGGLGSFDRKKQVEDMTALDRTKQHQQGSRASARKLPKYVSLNCIVNEHNSEDACSESAGINSSLIATGIANDNRKSPKIIPLSLVLKKAKICHSVKLCKTESTHFYEEDSDCSVNSSDYSVDKYSIDDEDCSPRAEYEMQGFKRSRHSSNRLRSHFVAHCKRASAGTKNRRASVRLTRIKRHKNFANRSSCYSSSDKGNAMQIREACVLCGYGGGAMTRALKTKNILKSLLKGLTTTARSEKYVDSLGNASSGCTSLQNPVDSTHGDSIMNAENITSNSWTSFNHNSSLLGPRTMQWVHMVCGLWTPGTNCPNATTMSAFDVSGASPAKKNTGLLQSEPEGEHNANVGFYGRCMDHANDLSNHVNAEKECLRSNNWTCARTEGFKGRKGEGCPGTSHKKSEGYSGEISVSQEQINAWLRINGSKPRGREQKEYIHYKQLKGWKHLVVYKSGIHGLGLYTSVFIPRGSMVVEYVGEIVGQRVADKREIEYQSGKRQQYKSACYFFKIDREHIIDATRKGGIARFVNHSCQVMFFAERHINPGEEITYDYHFNREDEGQRIPCFCRSRYCRRYLN
ncbi:hypothetical protein HU200_010329 [Digitaria exilis]|uniref:Histone-lysine N-methyltransferase n=1 Tax=Digitaria exilis TaxID=1010633 RepID=A0A835KNI4_9POAL|nr:hypothetical protein HU200_010329 [Digitaria exilis]